MAPSTTGTYRWDLKPNAHPIRRRISPQIRMITRLFNYLTMLQNGAISFKCCQNVATPADYPRGLSGASRVHRQCEMHGVNHIKETLERGVALRLTGATVPAKKPTSLFWIARPTAARLNRRADNKDYVKFLISSQLGRTCLVGRALPHGESISQPQNQAEIHLLLSRPDRYSWANAIQSSGVTSGAQIARYSRGVSPLGVISIPSR